MREILFRGKSIVANSPNTRGFWVEGNLFHQTRSAYDEPVNRYHILDGATHIDGLDGNTEVWPETVGQFTGLIDKNGRKIFEGDILLVLRGNVMAGKMYPLRTELCVVKYCKDRFLMNAEYGYEDIGPLKYIEVIGNIHDNPELLEVK